MIIYRLWIQQSNSGIREWQREGWYLLGFVPLYVRDLEVSGRYGKKY